MRNVLFKSIVIVGLTTFFIHIFLHLFLKTSCPRTGLQVRLYMPFQMFKIAQMTAVNKKRTFCQTSRLTVGVLNSNVQNATTIFEKTHFWQHKILEERTEILKIGLAALMRRLASTHALSHERKLSCIAKHGLSAL